MTEPEPSDELLEQLRTARARSGCLNVRELRALVRFCALAFRDWHGVQNVGDVSITPVSRLTHHEMVEWLRLAEDLPAVARDVLKIQRTAATEGRRLALRQIPWPSERRTLLLELHQLAILGAHREKIRAERGLLEAVAKEKQFANGDARTEQRRRMVVETERLMRELSEQLQSLQTAGNVSQRTV